MAEMIESRIDRWLQPLKQGDGFREPGDQAPSLQATCSAILMLEGAGTLGGASPTERMAWGRYIQRCQRASDGLFAEAEATRRDADGSMEQGTLHQRTTYLALHALDALGLKPRHRLSFLDALLEDEGGTSWLGAPDGSQPGWQSESVAFLLTALIYRLEREDDPFVAIPVHRLLDRLAGMQDRSTGLWRNGSSAVQRASLVATARLIPFYDYTFRPAMALSQLIDTVLTLVQSWADPSMERDGAAERLAAVELLARFGKTVRYRTEACAHALERLDEQARSALASGGWLVPDHRGEGVVGERMRPARPPPESIWEAWLQLLPLIIIERQSQRGSREIAPWRFRRWPAPGYHHTPDALTAHERAVLPRWMRRPGSGRSLRPPESDVAPAISVIVPCFNLGRYLSEAVESLLAQSVQDLEILIVDDGSTDEATTLILERLDAPGTRLLRQRNMGVARARNRAIEEARGRYICCLDPDDRLRPTFLQQALQILDAAPAVGLVSGHFELFDCSDAIFRYPSCELPEQLIANRVIEPALFRRAAWQRAGGYCETFSSSGIEDWDLWISLLEMGYEARILPEIVWEYRIRPDQMSAGMYEPETWQKLLAELADRHPESYRAHLSEVVGQHGRRWVELREWLQDRERAIRWWRWQSVLLEAQRAERDRVIDEQQAWIVQQEAARAWWEGQARSFEALANEREQFMRKQALRLQTLVARRPGRPSRPAGGTRSLAPPERAPESPRDEPGE